MQKLITILFLVIWCAAVAQVGFGDKAISPRVGLGLQKNKRSGEEPWIKKKFP